MTEIDDNYVGHEMTAHDLFSEATEYVKNAPTRLTHAAHEATEYTKELMSHASTEAILLAAKLQSAFIGQKEQAPAFLQDNEFIHAGYRIEHTTCCLALKSLFTCHNESVNVWSHLLGAISFFLFFIGLCIMVIPNRFQVGRDLL